MSQGKYIFRCDHPVSPYVCVYVFLLVCVCVQKQTYGAVVVLAGYLDVSVVSRAGRPVPCTRERPAWPLVIAGDSCWSFPADSLNPPLLICTEQLIKFSMLQFATVFDETLFVIQAFFLSSFNKNETLQRNVLPIKYCRSLYRSGIPHGVGCHS